MVCVDIGLDSLIVVLYPMKDDWFLPWKNVLFTETLYVLFFDWLTVMIQFAVGYTGLEMGSLCFLIGKGAEL